MKHRIGGLALPGGGRKVSGDLDRLTDALRRLARGDFKARSDIPYDKGKPGELARCLDELATSLQERNEELRDADEKRAAAEKRFQELFDSMSEGFALHEIICDPQGFPVDYRFLEANGAFERITGLRKDAIIGRTAREVIPNISPEWIETYGRVALTGESVSFERRAVQLKRDLHIVTFSPRKGHFATVFSDVTPRKRSEVQLRQQLRWMKVLNEVTRSIAQRNSIESILRVVLKHLEENLPVDFGGIALHGGQNRQARWSVLTTAVGEAIRQAGLVEKSLVPAGETELFEQLLPNRVTVFDLPELLVPAINRQRLEFLAGVEGQGFRSLVLVPVEGEKGRAGTILLAMRQPIKLNEYQRGFLQSLAESIALAIHNRDLYERLEESYGSLKRAQKSLLEQERLKAMGEMASGIAHDIANTLAPISMYSEALLENSLEMSPRAREFLNTIKEAARDIESKTARLRQFYRRSDEEENRRTLDVPALMRQVVELTRPRWEDQPQRQGIVVRVRTDTDTSTPPLVAVESDVRDALVNLVFNAVDAMPQGGTVSLKAFGAGGSCVLEVTDSGTGMDESTRRRCLEPFFTTKGESGTGLGLAVVYGTMRRHEGEIEIDSSPGHGTTVRLRFPAAAAKAATATPQRRTRSASSLHILCVDDDTAVRNALKSLLQLAGHKVAGAESGKEALRLMNVQLKRGERFDVVITDLGMPHMDGRQLAGGIKKLDSRVPVILLSGWGLQAEPEDGSPDFVDRVLSKPPRMDELRDVIQEVFERSKEAEG
jgi:PAS domain S-box-containing protein